MKSQARDVDEALSQVLDRARTSMLFSSGVTLAVLVAVSWTNVRSLAHRGEARFRALVQHGSDMLVTVDGTGTITYASPSVTATLGHGADELRGTRFAVLVHPDDAARAEALATPPRPRGGSSAGGVHHLRLRTVAGGWRHGEVLVSSMEDGTMVLTIRDVEDRLALEAELRRRAVQDPGTGLANGAALREALTGGLAVARRDHQPLVVIGLGLDGLREVRTLEGVVRADALLAAAAARVEGLMGDLLVAARVTDDELVLVATGCPEGADGLAAGVVERLAQPVVVEGQAAALRASVGVTTSFGDHTPDDLVHDVSLAVAQARADGGRRWVHFDPSVHQAAQAQAELVGDLRNAIAHGGLRLHYQPIVALATGAVVGVEALCRWPHPTLGMVPPGRFIPLAESSGDIEALGRWALGESCRELRRWQAAGRAITVSVNVAVAQLHDPAFVDEVAATILATGVDPAGLVLEITESNLVSESVLDNARALRALGVGIAIDDFGTGYSSLSYLGRLPVTSLKVDKSFVDRLGQDRPSHDLVGTIVELAHSFDLRTVAEGIESEEQAAILRSLGCQLGQGFLWSTAVPAEELDRFMAATPVPTRDVSARLAAHRTSAPHTGPQRGQHLLHHTTVGGLLLLGVRPRKARLRSSFGNPSATIPARRSTHQSAGPATE